MVKFIFGGGGSGKSEYIMEDISKVLSRSDRKALLLVPEQQTVKTETKLAERFDPSLFFRLEATNFTRLADSVARRTGGLSYSKLTDGGRSLILWRAMISVWDFLSEDTAKSVREGDETKLIPYVSSALKELFASEITSEELASAAEKLYETDESVSSLCGKAKDLSAIGAVYSSLLTEEFGEVVDPLARLAKNLRGSGYLKDVSVYVDSFYSVTGAESMVLGELIREAENVTVAVPMSDKTADGAHLAGVQRFYKTLLRQALQFGEVETVTLGENRRAKFRELCAAEKYLWSYGHVPEKDEFDRPSDPESVKVYSVRDRYDEAEAAAAVIEKLARNGAKYSDIAVVAADVDKLRGITDSCFKRHGIPVFTSEPSRLISSPVTRLILSLLKIPGKWRREDVIQAVKTGLFRISESDACILENYTETWNIRGRRMFSSPWSMNPAGYATKLSDWGRQALASANRAREEVIPLMERFCDIFDGGRAPAEKICTALVHFAEDCGIYDATLRRAEDLEKSGYADEAARERLVWREICSCFDTIVEILGDSPVDPPGFSSLFVSVASDAETGAIPTGVDEVIFASASSLRTDGAPHIIILGAVEGEFPAAVKKESYFTDDDKERLAELGIVLGASSEERASEELFRFYRVISQACESLTVFVPSVSFGESRLPSQGASRLEDILGDIAKPTPFASVPIEERIYSVAGLRRASLSGSGTRAEKSALSSLYRKIEGLNDNGINFASAESNEISPAAADELFGRKMNLSQSRIQSFVECPFSYYSKYVLKLAPERRAEVSAPDIGSFVHSILERFFTVTSGMKMPLSRDETSKICDDLVESYVRDICGDAPEGRLKYLFVRLRRQVLLFLEAVMKELAQSRFQIYGTEIPIGLESDSNKDPDVKSPSPVVFRLNDGTEVSLRGVADRIDVYKRERETFVRVIDYKTGPKKFSYEDIKIGLNIQLLLYLFSAWKSEGTEFFKSAAESGDLLPAGAVYLSLRPGDVLNDGLLSEEEARKLALSKVERSGIVVDDKDVLDAMDRGITGEFAPVKKNKDGSFRAGSSLASLERFGELYREMEEVVTGIAKKMKEGCAAANPLSRGGSTPCSWCKFSSFCRSKI